MLRMGCQTLRIEAEAPMQLQDQQGESFVRVVHAILNGRGRVVVMGMGKTAMSDARSPRRWPRPARRRCSCTRRGQPRRPGHGHAGRHRAGALNPAKATRSPRSRRRSNAPGRDAGGDDRPARSTLASHADWCCRTGSSRRPAAQPRADGQHHRRRLALGDALAVALLDARGFRPEGLRALAPGRCARAQLLTHVRDIMRQGEAVPRWRRTSCPR